MVLFLVALFLFTFFHIIIWHFKLWVNRGVSAIIGLAGMCWMAACFSKVLSGFSLTLGELLLAFSLYMCCIMFYLHWYVGIDRSVSVRILGELVEAPQGHLNLNTLEEIYPRKHMFKHRIDLMVKTGWLIEQQGRYCCTAKGAFLARMAEILKNIYGLKQTG